MTAAIDIAGATLRADDLSQLRALVEAGISTSLPRRVLLVADFRPSMLQGRSRAFRSVAAAEALTVLGWQVSEAGGSVGLMTLGTGAPVRVPLDAGAEGMRQVVSGFVRGHEAAAAHATAGCLDDVPLDRLLSDLDLSGDEIRAVVIASGFEFPGGGCAALLQALSAKHPVRLVHVTDAAEADETTGQGRALGLPVVTLDAGLLPEAMPSVLAEVFR
ncbi:hypothetical protein SAMN04488105_11492 [Salipiger thiooxidans]|uniref:DUF58 domain-containing protein n=1 Tax=Salipiger thiooxidans TaxID=282683 RepID=A0A1G7J4U4_9RHOB|nr:hypothetical protein [Salipiger thiooxidans]SDF19913.1 hypothetical protein SAMN04488105_11492 [Salipiger thiooxidans]